VCSRRWERELDEGNGGGRDERSPAEPELEPEVEVEGSEPVAAAVDVEVEAADELIDLFDKIGDCDDKESDGILRLFDRGEGEPGGINVGDRGEREDARRERGAKTGERDAKTGERGEWGEWGEWRKGGVREESALLEKIRLWEVTRAGLPFGLAEALERRLWLWLFTSPTRDACKEEAFGEPKWLSDALAFASSARAATPFPLPFPFPLAFECLSPMWDPIATTGKGTGEVGCDESPELLVTDDWEYWSEFTEFGGERGSEEEGEERGETTEEE